LESLVPGQALDGAAIIEAETTTILLSSGDRATVNPLGWVEIDIALTSRACELTT
jgi:N-methylhydantoinase A